MAVAPAAIAFAETPWAPASTTLPGAARAGSREVPVKAGDATSVALQRLPAGASVSVLYGTELLTPEPLKADAEGKVTVPLKVPEGAERGFYPLTIVTQNPASVSQVVLKVSEVVPPLNADAFTLKTVPVGERAYQSALSADGKLFVATARGPNDGSTLVRLDAATLAVEAQAEVPKDAKGKQIGVFGVAVDNAHGKVWTTNTLSETLTVYDAADLKPAKIFPEGSIQHPRDIAIDEANNRAYVSAALSPFVEVYDTETLEHVGQLEFVADRGRAAFGTIDLTLDAKNGRLYSISRDTPWIGWIDLATGKSTTVSVPQAQGATDIDRDPETGRLYVVSQESNNVVVLDAEGEVLADTYIGAGGVSVVWDAKTAQVFAATRAGGSVAVLDRDGKLVANIPVDETPNHLTAGPDGAVYLVSMYGKPGDDDQAGSVTRITPAK
ncbi:YncE family protein [Paenirhodobacter sp.]|uniref:YncE family protein n=1 Tax=Paenirhodobacter sp. TaxID=1965326 RepID=UPI003B415F0B